MTADSAFDAALAALLDGRRLPEPPAGDAPPVALEPLRVMEAVARAHRVMLFGEDAADAGSATPARTRWGHLEVGEELGRGASGTVYRAWDTRLSREVALKLLTGDDRRASDEALAEGRLLARLRHPHIVTVYGADTHDGVSGLWMELVHGDTLDDVLDRDGVFGVEEVLLAGIDLAGALAAVHAAGLLHRDVKARNVIRERGGRLLLMDLGAGRRVDEATPGGDTTGTPLYMAPEVLGGGAATERSDVYGLGVLLYRLLTGAYPVVAKGLAELRAAHTAGRRTPLALMCPDVPPAVERAIEQAADPDPGRRIPRASELERALRDALSEVLAARAPVWGLGARWWVRWRRAVFVGTACVALASLVGWTAWDTGAARSLRRAVGLPVPPLSPLYVTAAGGLLIVDGTGVTVVAGNPASAPALAVSADLGVRTLSGIPPWPGGATFALDGTPVAGPHAATDGMCCFNDGTTDGEFNYAVRQDSTLLAPIGSRPLAPRALFRFARDWSDPQPLFFLTPSGSYTGVTYSGASGTFWTTRNEAGVAEIEQWRRDGERVSAPLQVDPPLLGVAADPRDGTLWVVKQVPSQHVLALDNYDVTGRHLGTYTVSHPLPVLGGGGAEFAWRGRR